jgi:lipid A 3-O-deacylase
MRALLAFRSLGFVLLLIGFWVLGPREGMAQVLDVVDHEPAFIALGAGAFDALDDDTAGQFNFEYRSNRRLWIFKPHGGLMVSTDGAIYGYAGLRIDLYFGRRWVLSPSTAIGLYEEGSGKDLGSILEFRSGLELGYRFNDRSRLSAGLFHLSNASVSNRNPGEESIVLFYAVPIERLKRHW